MTHDFARNHFELFGLPVSFAVSPSKTITCTTSINSGDSDASTAPASPRSIDSSTRSSVLASAPCAGNGAGRA